jgi:hypothetical protein
MSLTISKKFLKILYEQQFKNKVVRICGSNAREIYCGVQKYCWFFIL